MKRFYTDSISLTFHSSLLALLLIVLAGSTTARADMVTIDFRQLYTEESPEDLSAAAILRYLNSNEATAGIVEAIPYSEFTYGYHNGLNKYTPYSESKNYPKESEGYGALYITATDSVTMEDTGGITFRIAPKYLHKNTNLNIYLFKDIDNTGIGSQVVDTELEVAINGGDFQKAEISRSDAYWCTFNIKPEGEIIREVALRIPNPNRDSEGELKSDSYLPYFLAFTHINLYYSSDEKAEKVTTWQFSQATHDGYLSDAETYTMPTFTAIPAEAAEFVEFTSSDPSVAEIKDGKVALKTSGKTTITANLVENSLFKAAANLPPASYELTVSDSTSTAVEQIAADNAAPELFYDLHGRITDTANLQPGIYIRRQGDKVEKIIIR